MKILAKLRAYEPIRLYVYPLLVILIGFLVTRGAIDPETGELISGLVEAVAVLIFGVAAAEAARAKVTPQIKVAEMGAQAVRAVEDARAGRPIDIAAILKAARDAGTYFGNVGEHRAE